MEKDGLHDLFVVSTWSANRVGYDSDIALFCSILKCRHVLVKGVFELFIGEHFFDEKSTLVNAYLPVMYNMEIKDAIEWNIDHVQDGINFNLKLFNEGQYDKEQLRTIIRNTGVELGITNTLSIDIEIKNVYFGIVENGLFSKLFFSSQLSQSFPLRLSPKKMVVFYFYGWEIKKILQKFEREEGSFFFSTTGDVKYFFSEKFSGAAMEDLLIQLEDDEIANWGNNLFCPLDIEISI